MPPHIIGRSVGIARDQSSTPDRGVENWATYDPAAKGVAAFHAKLFHTVSFLGMKKSPSQFLG